MTPEEGRDATIVIAHCEAVGDKLLKGYILGFYLLNVIHFNTLCAENPGGLPHIGSGNVSQ